MMTMPTIRVVHPEETGKQFMLAFIAENTEQAWLGNYAVHRALNEANLNPFHQVGRENEPGYHAWEVWMPVTEELMFTLRDVAQNHAANA